MNEQRLEVIDARLERANAILERTAANISGFLPDWGNDRTQAQIVEQLIARA